MTKSPTDAPDTARITIGVRRYHAATGEFTTVREPQQFAGVLPTLVNMKYPPCACPRCR